jgi:gamma-glutamylcyclotransferase (GGCT)/AIG2-like uncharacterized protein YtfP
MPQHLFIYGTLHPNLAPPEIQPTVRQLTYVTTATIQGAIRQFSGYPGLVLNRPNPQPIPGHVFALPDLPEEAARVLREIDRYEDFRPDDPEASLFLRVERPVTLPGGSSLLCWLYVYNR